MKKILSIILILLFLVVGIYLYKNKYFISNKNDIIKVGNYPSITWVEKKMLLSKDDKYLFVINNKIPNQIDILDISDLSKPKLINSILVSNKKENFIAEYKLSEDKNYLYTATYVDKKILVFNISNINDIKKINELPILNFSSFGIKGKYLYIAGCIDSKYCDYLNVYSLENKKFISKINIKGIIEIVISPDGNKMFYRISPSRTERIGFADISNPLDIKVLDETGKIFNNRGRFATSAGIKDIIFSNDSSKIYIAGNQVGLMVYDISKNKLENIQLTSGIHSKMIFNSTEGIYNISLDKKNNLYLIGPPYNKKYKYINNIEGVNNAVWFSGNGSVKVSDDGKIIITQGDFGLNFYKKINN